MVEVIDDVVDDFQVPRFHVGAALAHTCEEIIVNAEVMDVLKTRPPGCADQQGLVLAGVVFAQERVFNGDN